MVMIVLCAINVQFNFDRTHVGTRWVRSHKEKRWATIGSTTEENVIKGQSIRCHLDRGQNSGWGWLVLEGPHWVHSFLHLPSVHPQMADLEQCSLTLEYTICENVARRYLSRWNAAEMVLLLILGGLLHSWLILGGPCT